ncbi:MAG: peptidyl-prolyl cis-trans isomerase, partial [Desulfobacterales bacterium]|nr:peptidyl-prolyl cis-trans isomerase [Desulfobacterales bacterium]
KWGNASVNIDYILFEPGRYKDIDPSAEDIKAFFVDHKNSYKTEPMIKVRFLCFDPDNYRARAIISDKMIQDYYEAHQEEFKTDKVEKINEESIISIDEAKKGIRKKLIDEEAKILAYEEAESVYDTIFEGDDLVKASNERQLKLQTTDFFTIKGPDKGIKNRKKFASAAFNLSAMEISDIQDLGDGYYILQVIEKNPGEISELKDVEEKVRTALIKEKQDENANTDANEFLSGLKKGKLMSAQCVKYGLKLSSSGFFKRNEPIPDIGLERGIIEAAFKLSNKIKLPEKVIKGEKGYYVISFKERKEAAPEGFIKEKASIKEGLLRQKRIKTFDEWLTQIRNKSNISIEKGFFNQS